MIKRFLVVVSVLLFLTSTVFAQNVWINDLRSVFLSKNAIIYAINIRTFGAQDTNNDGIIDEDEESGNFLNAIGMLDEVRSYGVNTLHLLPIMPVGKVRALGTAGSLYAMSDFTSLNPQLKSKRSALSVEDQAIKFINEAHKRNMRVMLDLPSCGSYDLYLSRPDLFLKDANGEPLTPSDWKDVRVFDAGSENHVNVTLLNLHKAFIDYAIKLGADGIRADVATLKPASFWKELIEYARNKDPQFLFLAESSDSWTKPVSPNLPFTPYNKLLEAGFDGFYGSFFSLDTWTTASDLMKYVNFINSLKFAEPKAVIGSFTTHDTLSPILIKGPRYSTMIMWLNSTLPVNAYYVDGFATGDTYTYLWGNKKARKTYTDSDIYFVHRGKLDIFNFSKKPGGQIKDLEPQFVAANKFKYYISQIIANGKFTEIKTNNSQVFAYAQSYNNVTVLVFGNINFEKHNEASVKVVGFDENKLVIPMYMNSAPRVTKNVFNLNLEPGEIQVYLINELSL